MQQRRKSPPGPAKHMQRPGVWCRSLPIHCQSEHLCCLALFLFCIVFWKLVFFFFPCGWDEWQTNKLWCAEKNKFWLTYPFASPLMNWFFSSVAKTTGIHLATFKEKKEKWRHTAHCSVHPKMADISKPVLTAKPRQMPIPAEPFLHGTEKVAGAFPPAAQRFPLLVTVRVFL